MYFMKKIKKTENKNIFRVRTFDIFYQTMNRISLKIENQKSATQKTLIFSYLTKNKKIIKFLFGFRQNTLNVLVLVKIWSMVLFNHIQIWFGSIIIAEIFNK